jgi:hypothetical protein
MNETLVKKIKWFWAWQDVKEEAWLEEMARQGLHLKSPGAFGHYIFVQGEPRRMAYRFDFVTSPKKDEAYFQLFRDAGWEHVGELGGWQYWRKPVEAGQSPEIFTDVHSKVQKYERLAAFLLIFIPIFVVNFINFGDIYNRNRPPFGQGLIDGIYGISLVMFMIIAVSLIMIVRRIFVLKQK